MTKEDIFKNYKRNCCNNCKVDKECEIHITENCKAKCNLLNELEEQEKQEQNEKKTKLIKQLPKKCQNCNIIQIIDLNKGKFYCPYMIRESCMIDNVSKKEKKEEKKIL